MGPKCGQSWGARVDNLEEILAVVEEKRKTLGVAGRRLLLGEDGDSVPTGEPEEFQELFLSSGAVRCRFAAARVGRQPLPSPATPAPDAICAPVVEEEVAPGDKGNAGTTSVVCDSPPALDSSEEEDDENSCDG